MNDITMQMHKILLIENRLVPNFPKIMTRHIMLSVIVIVDNYVIDPWFLILNYKLTIFSFECTGGA